MVLGVKVTNTGGYGGLLGILSDGHTTYAVTDNTWKCTRNFYDKWAEPDFNTNTWPQAEPVSEGESIEGENWNRVLHIAPNAQLIWNGPRKILGTELVQYLTSQTVTVYCRKQLNITKPATLR